MQPPYPLPCLHAGVARRGADGYAGCHGAGDMVLARFIQGLFAPNHVEDERYSYSKVSTSWLSCFVIYSPTNKIELSTRMTNSNIGLPFYAFLRLIPVLGGSPISIFKPFNLLSRTFHSGTGTKLLPLSGPAHLVGSSVSSSPKRESTSTWKCISSLP